MPVVIKDEEEEKKEKEEEKEKVVPYPVPRKIRTQRPWRFFITGAFVLVALVIVGLSAWQAFGDVAYEENANEYNNIEIKMDQVNESIEEEKAVGKTSTYLPVDAGTALAKEQNALMSLSGVDTDAVSDTVYPAFGYVGQNYDMLRPWWYPELGSDGSPNTSPTWEFCSSYSTETNDLNILWQLMTNDSVFAYATGVYHGETDTVSDVVVTNTLAGDEAAGEVPQQLQAWFDDGENITPLVEQFNEEGSGSILTGK